VIYFLLQGICIPHAVYKQLAFRNHVLSGFPGQCLAIAGLHTESECNGKQRLMLDNRPGVKLRAVTKIASFSPSDAACVPLFPEGAFNDLWRRTVAI
jgi:hypothetical protein